jgi:hypothetical protein
MNREHLCTDVFLKKITGRFWSFNRSSQVLGK